MKARRVARELALLSLSQISKSIKNLDGTDIQDLIVCAVRTLSEYSSSNLKNSIPDLLSVKEYLEDVEINDPSNLETPMDAEIKPVTLPKTNEVKGHVNKLLVSAESILQAMEVAEVSALANTEEVKLYAIKLIRNYLDNAKEIDTIISKYSEGWPIDRLLKIDKSILRIAIVEMKYIDDVPLEVSIDEAVEMLKKYSSEESPKFINGILGQVYNYLKEE